VRHCKCPSIRCHFEERSRRTTAKSPYPFLQATLRGIPALRGSNATSKFLLIILTLGYQNDNGSPTYRKCKLVLHRPFRGFKPVIKWNGEIRKGWFFYANQEYDRSLKILPNSQPPTVGWIMDTVRRCSQDVKRPRIRKSVSLSQIKTMLTFCVRRAFL
jgi:hypothetical protein